MHAEVKGFVEEGKHAGIATLVARNGRVVDLYSYGKASLDPVRPMRQDTIFRIYSMSKIVTSVAALVLLEEARFKLDEPVGSYLPELAKMKVWTGGTKDKPLLADSQKPITIESLLTHSSGLIYGFGSAPLDQLYKDAKVEQSGSGAATTRARIDPKERLLTLFFTQHFPSDEHGLFWRLTTLVYSAITD
jgi:CubicO group peptidase (beta-lactamase class C family)